METEKGTKVLVDCGLIQGGSIAEEVNREKFPYDPADIGALIVTHAHLDHVGRIPKLVKEGFRGVIYSTPETRALTELVLTDAVGILAQEAERKGELPIYEANDVLKVFPLWKVLPYHESMIFNDLNFLFRDAGHILGSAMVEISVDGKKILFTGDMGNSPAPILADTEAPGEPDYIVMESVYGDRNHEPREERKAHLEKIINDTLSRGGTLVIPAFSIDRTQVLLYELNNMVEEGVIPDVPIFLDSPLATKATEVYRSSSHLFRAEVQEQIRKGDNIFNFPKLRYTVSQRESHAIEHEKGAKIILAGSGMSVGGRVVGHEEFFLPDPKSTILLVGYQTAGSLGRRLAEGEKKVNIHNRSIKVKAHIETLYGYSAHRDSDHLVEFVGMAGKKPTTVFVAMGEPSASMHLAQRINDELGIKAIAPERGSEYEL
ncbi:MAG: MBL fold metallo-hydrolase [Candidatus Paceibacterota bacterium]